jgi:hypothetical protein
VTEQGPRTPQAMRASVTDRVCALVKADRRLQLNDLLRQFAYDRLLARVFSGDAGYAREARNAPGLIDRDLDAAVEIAASFINPILSGAATGAWDPQTVSWKAEG